MRTAIGEGSPAFGALARLDKIRLQGIAASLASVRMQLDESVVDELLCEAERVARARRLWPRN